MLYGTLKILNLVLKPHKKPYWDFDVEKIPLKEPKPCEDPQPYLGGRPASGCLGRENITVVIIYGLSICSQERLLEIARHW